MKIFNWVQCAPSCHTFINPFVLLIQNVLVSNNSAFLKATNESKIQKNVIKLTTAVGAVPLKLKDTVTHGSSSQTNKLTHSNESTNITRLILVFSGMTII